MSAVERRATVTATPDRVWSLLADFGALSAWVPLIQHSCLLTDQTEGVGTTRRVQIMHQTLVERVTTWSPGNELAYSIEGLPPIVGTARNTWRIGAAPGGSEVVVTTEIDTGRNPLKMLVASKVLERMATASEFMLAGLGQVVAAPPTDETDETAETDEQEDRT